MPAVPVDVRPDRNPAAVLVAPGNVRQEDREVPVPAEDEVLVRIEAVGVCGSDVHYYREGRIGSYVVDAPLILGHESAGTVVACGEGVGTVSVGTRVAIEPGIPCGRCRQCHLGRYNLCPAVRFFATPPVDGAFQQYVAVRSDFVFPLPDSVSFEAGALVEPLAVAVWACRTAAVGPGMDVLITGAGPVGLLALQTALAFGAATVTVTDVDDDKLAIARKLGAGRTVHASSLATTEVPVAADVHIECSGNTVAALHGIERLNPSGVCVLVGMGAAGNLQIPVALVQEKELRITGTFRYANCYPTAIQLLASGRVTTEDLITSRFPLAEAAQALESTTPPGALKALVLPTQ